MNPAISLLNKLALSIRINIDKLFRIAYSSIHTTYTLQEDYARFTKNINMLKYE